MDLFICMAMITSSSVNEDAAYIASVRTMRRLTSKNVGLDGAIDGPRLSSGHRHVHVPCRREVLAEATKTWQK